jgi:hypothetical protein
MEGKNSYERKRSTEISIKECIKSNLVGLLIRVMEIQIYFVKNGNNNVAHIIFISW